MRKNAFLRHEDYLAMAEECHRLATENAHLRAEKERSAQTDPDEYKLPAIWWYVLLLIALVWIGFLFVWVFRFSGVHK